jgi:hypothetical protein
MSDQARIGSMARGMNWSKARRRQTQSIKDDDTAGARWLARFERQQHDDGVTWGPWKRFEREFTSGWERTGVRK